VSKQLCGEGYKTVNLKNSGDISVQGLAKHKPLRLSWGKFLRQVAIRSFNILEMCIFFSVGLNSWSAASVSVGTHLQ
jgi:hypothetical protein